MYILYTAHTEHYVHTHSYTHAKHMHGIYVATYIHTWIEYSYRVHLAIEYAMLCYVIIIS